MRRLLVLSALLAAQSFAADGWQKLPPMPEPSGGFVCGEENGKVVVIGGTNWRNDVKHFLASRHVFDPATMTWEKADSLPEPIAYAVSGVSDGKLVWAGGTNGAGSVRRGAAMPAEVIISAGGVIGDEIVFVGGTDDVADLAHLTRAAFALNLKSGAVTKLPDFPGKSFGTAASAVIGDRLFVFGGVNWNGDVANTADAYALSLGAREWRKLKPLPFAVRGLTGVALSDTRIYLAGGYKSDAEEFSDDALIYDTATDSYAPAPRLPYRAMVGLVKCGEFLYCFGGEDRKKSRTDQCWRIRVAELLR
ncbi:MAG: kelch repeat-containing protein [Chthoniobacteraceae bacterium]